MNENLINKLVLVPKIESRKTLIAVGHLIWLDYKIEEGEKFRIQKHKGLVISLKNRGISRTFKIRQTIQGIIVDQTFFLNSPKIISIVLKKVYKVRRSKLFFLNKYKRKLKISKKSN